MLTASRASLLVPLKRVTRDINYMHIRGSTVSTTEESTNMITDRDMYAEECAIYRAVITTYYNFIDAQTVISFLEKHAELNGHVCSYV